MATQSEREVLVTRFQVMKASEGLKDVKFFLGKVSEATVDQVCGDVNSLLDKVENGEVHTIDKWNDSHKD